MLNLHLFPAGTLVTAFFCPADMFRKSALSQAEAWMAGKNHQERGSGHLYSTALSKGVPSRRGSLHCYGWPANSGHVSHGYPALSHQNLPCGKCSREGPKAHLTRRHFSARQALPPQFSSLMLLPGVGCSLAELCPAVQPLPTILHCPHEDFPIIPCPTEPSPLVLRLVLVVPWHYHVLCVSAEPTLTAKKVRLVGVQLGKYIWELTVLE